MKLQVNKRYVFLPTPDKISDHTYFIHVEGVKQEKPRMVHDKLNHMRGSIWAFGYPHPNPSMSGGSPMSLFVMTGDVITILSINKRADNKVGVDYDEFEVEDSEERVKIKEPFTHSTTIPEANGFLQKCLDLFILVEETPFIKSAIEYDLL